eukprot:TRINITY_DN14919_c0_g1_i2.p1 TRINITY_DN14919_c0_g1~~TRINITY_DN14919_c0_g1_i2.p1  ORF type:complete len:190 (+),score=39.09 TRINITY_DN14919_c0_g1_i2:60-572(+)
MAGAPVLPPADSAPAGQRPGLVYPPAPSEARRPWAADFARGEALSRAAASGAQVPARRHRSADAWGDLAGTKEEDGRIAALEERVLGEARRRLTWTSDPEPEPAPYLSEVLRAQWAGLSGLLPAAPPAPSELHPPHAKQRAISPQPRHSAAAAGAGTSCRRSQPGAGQRA